MRGLNYVPLWRQRHLQCDIPISKERVACEQDHRSSTAADLLANVVLANPPIPIDWPHRLRLKRLTYRPMIAMRRRRLTEPVLTPEAWIDGADDFTVIVGDRGFF